MRILEKSLLHGFECFRLLLHGRDFLFDFSEFGLEVTIFFFELLVFFLIGLHEGLSSPQCSFSDLALSLEVEQVLMFGVLVFFLLFDFLLEGDLDGGEGL